MKRVTWLLVHGFVALLIAAISMLCRTNAWADQSAGASSPAAAASSAAAANASPAAAATPAPPLTSPTMVGPLQMASPHEINLPKMLPALSELPAPIANLFDFDVNAVVSGLVQGQNHPVRGDFDAQVDASNAELIVQKADGLIQYYLQVGGYSIPALGAPYINLGHAVNALYGPLPVAYLKIAPTDSFSIIAGNLPSLFGAEYTFTFENMNVERGLLWNQENAITRGVQLNYSHGPLSATLKWDNGFYSHSYTWVDGSLAYAINSANTLSFVGGGQVGFAKSNNFATPLLLNNSQIYNIIYEYNSTPWIFEPYFQLTLVPHDPDLGVFKTTSTTGGGILVSYAILDNLFLAGRGEFIGSNGRGEDGTVNLLYGPGSQAWSFTVTPTYQYKQFFVRPEFSYVQAINYASGFVFGQQFDHPTQVRGLLEAGFIW